MATIKLNTTCGELVDLMNGLFGVQDIPGKKLAMVVSKNISTLQGTLEHVEKVGKPTEEFMKFANEIKRLQDIGDQESMKKLEDSNAELIAERKIQIDKVQDLLKKESKAELEIITKEIIPENVTARQINNLEKIII